MNNVNVEITVECFVEKDGKHLMLRRHPSKRILPNVWIAPGGHQEPGEGLFACTRREIKEETGLEIKNIRLRAVGRGYLQDINTEFAFHILTATYASGELISNPADGELIWLTPEEMLNLDNVLEELKPLFPLILNENNGVISVRAAYDGPNHLSEFEIEDPS